MCVGCNVVYFYVVVVIGIIVGMVYVVWSIVMFCVKIDDFLDVVVGK